MKRLSTTAGLLLAGGRSQRFGDEKAIAEFGGRTLMEAVAERFSDCAAFAVSARPDSGAARRARVEGWTLLHDAPAHPAGPLSGICAGLQWAHDAGMPYLAIAPCDAPLLPVALFSELHKGLGNAPAIYAVTSGGEHPLCALWRVSLLTPLAALLDSGRHPAVRDFLLQHGAARLAFDEPGRFANANTLNDLAAMERTL